MSVVLQFQPTSRSWITETTDFTSVVSEEAGWGALYAETEQPPT